MPNFNSNVQQPTYPTQPVTSQGGGTGGLVDRNKIINDSVQNALNQTNQIMQMQRDRKAYNEKQQKSAAVKGAAIPPAGIDGPDGAPAATSATGDGHQDFMASVLQGLHSVGSGIASIFGGGQPTPAGAIPAPPAAPSPAPAAAAPAPAAASTVAPGSPPGMEDGGPVTPEYHKSTLGDLAAQAVKEIGHAIFGDGAAARAADASRSAVSNAGNKADSQVQGYEQGGVIRNMGVNPQFQRGPAPGMGVVAGGTLGIPGFEDGGTIPGNQTAAVAQATPDPRADLVKQVEDLHQDMLGHDLNGDDKPNNAQAIPAGQAPAPAPSDSAAPAAPPSGSAPGPAPAQGAAPAPQSPAIPAPPPDPAAQATAAAVKTVATDPVAQSGQVTTTPAESGKPHSIPMEKWTEWDQKIDKAVAAAAAAGEDPGQVRQALLANRNAWVQGNVLKYASAANVALLNGDNKGVEKALKNMYYYVPDGQELNIKHGPDGQIMFQDPVKPFTDDGKPNMGPVTAQTIQLFGQAMLDPQTVNKTIMEARAAAATASLKVAEAERDRQQGLAARDTGQGNLLKGSGIDKEGTARLQRVDAQNYKDLGETDAARIRANAIANRLSNTIHQNKLDPQLLKGAMDASNMFENDVQGQKTTIQGDPSQNPNVGKTTRDPTKSTIPNATPEMVADGKAIAGQIFLGANGSMPAAEASRLAALAVQAKRSSTLKPGEKKPTADMHTDPKTGQTWVWNKAARKWEKFMLAPTSAQDAASGNLGVTADDLDEATKADALGGSGGQSAIPTSSSVASNDTPDMEDQKMEGNSTANES
jgi:hypothetical protein